LDITAVAAQTGLRPAELYREVAAGRLAADTGPAVSFDPGVVESFMQAREKSEQEPLRLLGQLQGDHVELDTTLKVSAHCNRIPVIDGHTACVSIQFAEQEPSQAEVLQIWHEFVGEPQRLGLPSAPQPAIVYREEPDRPQPRYDRGEGNGMSVVVGKVRSVPTGDLAFTLLSHNTIRGAAGAAILNAELLYEEGLL